MRTANANELRNEFTQTPQGGIVYDGSRGNPDNGFGSWNAFYGGGDGYLWAGGGPGGKSHWMVRRNGVVSELTTDDGDPGGASNPHPEWGPLVGNPTASGAAAWVHGLTWVRPNRQWAWINGTAPDDIVAAQASNNAPATTGSGNAFGSFFGGGSGSNPFGNLFGSSSSGGSSMNFNDMISGFMNMQMSMAMMNMVMSMMSNMSGSMGGGMGGSSNSFVGPLLNKTSNSALTTAVNAALANTNGLAGTTAGNAIQGGKDLANALLTYASSQGNAATVQALTGPGANSTAALAIALVG